MYEIRVEPLYSSPPAVDMVLNATDAPNYQWLAHFRRDFLDEWSLLLGVNSFRFPPSVFQTDRGVGFLGAEQAVFSLDLHRRKVLNRVTDLTFLRAINLTDSGIVLVTSEDELLGFSPEGAFVWRVRLADVMEDSREEDGTIHVTDTSGRSYRIEAATGRSQP
jgi:hypothetical protein